MYMQIAHSKFKLGEDVYTIGASWDKSLNDIKEKTIVKCKVVGIKLEEVIDARGKWKVSYKLRSIDKVKSHCLGIYSDRTTGEKSPLFEREVEESLIEGTKRLANELLYYSDRVDFI